MQECPFVRRVQLGQCFPREPRGSIFCGIGYLLREQTIMAQQRGNFRLIVGEETGFTLLLSGGQSLALLLLTESYFGVMLLLLEPDASPYCEQDKHGEQPVRSWQNEARLLPSPVPTHNGTSLRGFLPRG